MRSKLKVKAMADQRLNNADYGDISRHMKFMEQLIEENFQGYLCSPLVMANIIADIIGQAACSMEWGIGYATPDAVYKRVVKVMEELRGMKASDDIAALLAGRRHPQCPANALMQLQSYHGTYQALTAQKTLRRLTTLLISTSSC